MNEDTKLEDIVSLCKRRGFVFPASDIYGGLAGFYDYGPLGTELLNKIKAEWWSAMVTENDNVFGVDGAIIQNPKLWEASGHVAGFTDPLVDCKNCGARHRADHLAGTDSTDLDELKGLLEGKKCPNCGKTDLTKPRTYNMMMKTYIGPIEDEDSIAYLRPETAGSIFTNFKNVQETMRAKLPFGIAQIGKAFRNEISPRDFIFRVRELEQMEMQYFINPVDEKPSYEHWREFAWDFVTNRMGIGEENVQWHEHDENERAHYAAAAHDIYFKFPFGFKELMGTHDRTDYDLDNHQKVSGKDMQYHDQVSGDKFIPYVIESSMGLGRLFLAVLVDAYHKEEINGEERTVLKLKPELAPYRVAVSPLLKNKEELVKKAREVYDLLKKNPLYSGRVMWDDNGNIGKRYRRQDEIGTPECIVIDFDTLEDNTVTVRDRDTTKQKRVKIDELAA
ncbi:MAG: glycine--tRNA ligase [Candidatus Saccharibacteria bacterium]|nr:glycine--tRNA ligase [Candidatus Saccharibacteria bacterium]